MPIIFKWQRARSDEKGVKNIYPPTIMKRKHAGVARNKPKFKFEHSHTAEYITNWVILGRAGNLSLKKSNFGGDMIGC